nr:hypothetical protein orf515 [uncultured bacterium]AGD93320.1 hypothetical protein orf515 [uncultured bacterium]
MIVPLRSKRRERAQALQKFQHAIPAAPLLLAGIHAIRAGGHGFGFWLGLFEIGTSALLLGTMVREIRALRRPQSGAAHAHHGVDWIEIFAAGVLTAEVLEHWHLTHHIRRPAVLTAIISLGMGLMHGRMTRFSERRRVLRLDDEGIHIGGRPFFKAFRASWSEVATIDVQERRARITRRDGRTRSLNLADLHGADQVRAALEEARLRLAAPD